MFQARGLFSGTSHEFRGGSTQAKTYAADGDDEFYDSETDSDEEKDPASKDKKPKKDRLQEL